MNETSHAATAAQRTELEAKPRRKHVATIEMPEGIEVVPTYVVEDNSHWLTISCEAGWDDVAKICKKVLNFEGRLYRFMSWNSDRNDCKFKAGLPKNFATFSK